MPEHPSPLSRRGFLAAGAAAGAAAVLPGSAAEARMRGRLAADPFRLGVASGDPTSDGVVLWTRLATNPIADDGHGGMPNAPVDVDWELATDENFATIVRNGTESAAYDWAHSVHVELAGLDPGREYWYRFKTGTYVSPPGRTRTAPAADSVAACKMAFVSCQKYDQGFYTNYAHLAGESPDLVLHLGDYQYEYPTASGAIRPVAGGETVTLANYRQRLAQYRSDPDLQAAHAAAPWMVVFDDHEVINNWYGGVEPGDSFRARRTAAFRAYWENMPLRQASLPDGHLIPLFRRYAWGRLATFHMLDTRQYRDEQACNDGWKDCPDRLDPSRNLPGTVQEQWLAEGFAGSTTIWDVLGQQVFFSQRNHPDNARSNSMDAWDGYVAPRDRVLAGWAAGTGKNLLVLTGDVHAHWASEIKSNFADPSSANVGTELVCSSISSGWDGSDVDLPNDPWLKANANIKYHNMRRGYVITEITETEVRAHFRGVNFVSLPDAPLQHRASFRIPAGDPKLEPISIQPLPPGLRPLTREENIRETIELETGE